MVGPLAEAHGPGVAWVLEEIREDLWQLLLLGEFQTACKHGSKGEAQRSCAQHGPAAPNGWCTDQPSTEAPQRPFPHSCNGILH